MILAWTENPQYQNLGFSDFVVDPVGLVHQAARVRSNLPLIRTQLRIFSQKRKRLERGSRGNPFK